VRLFKYGATGAEKKRVHAGAGALS
jgi:hypothetical protein